MWSFFLANPTEADVLDETVKLSDYFPEASLRQQYRNSAGDLYADYGYHRGRADFQSLYDKHFNLEKLGSLGVWEKRYAGKNAPATYGHLFFADDQSVMEVGDWLNIDKADTAEGKFIIFGYVNTADRKTSGLVWSPVGGFKKDAEGWPIAANTVHQFSQGTPSGEFKFKENDAKNISYAYVKVERLASFTPAYGSKNGNFAKGNGKTYSNIVRLLFYHGGNSGKAIDCADKPGNELKVLYSKVPNYTTYLSEYYLAPGKWIIQERTVYIENGEFWGLGDCAGAAFELQSDDSRGASYIDED